MPDLADDRSTVIEYPAALNSERRLSMCRRALALALVLFAGCAFSSKLTTSGLGSSSSGQSAGTTSAQPRQLTMPDLLGKTPEQAKQILLSAGFEIVRFEEATQNYVCDDRRDSYELFTICYQRPAPGYVTSNRVLAEYRISRSLPGRGEIGTPSEYVIMPEVRGKSLAEAKQILAKVGLPLEAHFDVERAGAHERCEPEVVCQTSPPPKLQKQLASRGTIVLGPKAPVRPPAPPSAPTTPSGSRPPEQPAQPSPPPDEKPGSFF